MFREFIKTAVMAVGLLSGAISVAAADPYGLPKASPESVGMSSQRLERMTSAMKQFVDDGQIAGMITAVARHGKLVHFETAGYADIKTGKAMKPDAMFRLASMTKPITGIAVMIAYEDGKFLLDDPVEKYLPEFKGIKVFTPEGLVEPRERFTVRQLLTHTAGFIRHVADHEFTDDLKAQAAQTHGATSLADYVKRIAGLPLMRQPGTEWRYSTAGIDVLGRLVEVWSGMTFEAFLQKRLFGPLGMVDTTFNPPKDKWDRIATLYTPDAQHGLVAIGNKGIATGGLYADHFGPDSQYGLETGGGGLVGTLADYMRFCQMLLNGGELDGVRILSPTTVKLISSNHLPESFGPTPLASLGQYKLKKPGLGFGLTMAVVNDPVAQGTAGSVDEYYWGGAYGTGFWIDPKQDLIGLIFLQILPGSVYSTRDRVHQMTYQAIIGE